MNIINGILAASLAFTGGTGLALFSEKETPYHNTVIQEQGGNYDQIVEKMESCDGGSMQKYMEERNINMEERNKNFGQMKRYLSEMHPNFRKSTTRRNIQGNAWNR
ncbi:hypothetical protein [Bacillus kwashiorkori]|uniref:hypothetical protein n=1 Tax=Bacillus kwashiorkori TaxID=1522318 RepID=UPI0007813CE1|nr:hypothetical protein [Bacillus kwashiorkori]